MPCAAVRRRGLRWMAWTLRGSRRVESFSRVSGSRLGIVRLVLWGMGGLGDVRRLVVAWELETAFSGFC